MNEPQEKLGMLIEKIAENTRPADITFKDGEVVILVAWDKGDSPADRLWDSVTDILTQSQIDHIELLHHDELLKLGIVDV